ncbi:hypothetical protein STANM309S_03832 [Streptomyces tanashiensis]
MATGSPNGPGANGSTSSSRRSDSTPKAGARQPSASSDSRRATR